MTRSSVKKVRENIKRFHEYLDRLGPHEKEMCLERVNYLKSSGLPQHIIDREVEEIKQRYKDHLIEHAGMFMPFYVGKQWYTSPAFWDYCKIIKVDWNIPELEDKDNKYPTVKSITYEEFNNRTYKKVFERTIEYPETNEEFLHGWENIADDKEDAS
jgi:hypothetical protein